MYALRFDWCVYLASAPLIPLCIEPSTHSLVCVLFADFPCHSYQHNILEMFLHLVLSMVWQQLAQFSTSKLILKQLHVQTVIPWLHTAPIAWSQGYNLNHVCMTIITLLNF